MTTDRDHLWEPGWDGHKNAQRRRIASLPLWVRIDWLEQAQQVAENLRQSRKTAPDPDVNRQEDC